MTVFAPTSTKSVKQYIRPREMEKATAELDGIPFLTASETVALPRINCPPPAVGDDISPDGASAKTAVAAQAMIANRQISGFRLSVCRVESEDLIRLWLSMFMPGYPMTAVGRWFREFFSSFDSITYPAKSQPGYTAGLAAGRQRSVRFRKADAGLQTSGSSRAKFTVTQTGVRFCAGSQWPMFVV